MKLYRVIKNGLVTNQWNSSYGLDENHYELCFGLPLRWVNALECSEQDIATALDLREVIDQEGISEVYNEQGELVQEAIPAVTHTEYKLPATYYVEIVDLDTDYDYLLALCRANRQAEYPEVQEYLDAVVQDDAAAILAYKQKCKAVKQKYPKPVKPSE